MIRYLLLIFLIGCQTITIENITENRYLYADSQGEPFEAKLMAEDGKILHTWNYNNNKTASFVKLYGNVLFTIERDRPRAIVALDYNSNELFRISGFFHHDLDVKNGKVYAMALSEQYIGVNGKNYLVVDENITIYDIETKKTQSFSLYNMISKNKDLKEYVESSLSDPSKINTNINAKYKKKNNISGIDLFHANSLQMIGNNKILMSLRTLDTLLIANLNTGRVEWFFNGEGVIDGQHCANLLEDGNILLFDNGIANNQSRAVKIDKEGNILWEYTHKGLYSYAQGCALLAANGDILITESAKSSAYRINTNGQVVWNWTHPDKKRIYRIYPIN